MLNKALVVVFGVLLATHSIAAPATAPTAAAPAVPAAAPIATPPVKAPPAVSNPDNSKKELPKTAAHPKKQSVRKPCGGKKGGVASCENGKFKCNDGSFSTSKKTCDPKTLLPVQTPTR